MKKPIAVAIIIIILNMMDVLACDYEMVRKQDIIPGRYIGELFFINSDNGEIHFSADGENYNETEPIVNSDYSIYYNNGIYLFIDESKDSYPENKLYGGVRKNSPMYFFDKDMYLSYKAEYDGYFDFRKCTENGFYFSFIDTSSYKYDKSINRYTGEKITRYYKSDGMTMDEISYEEFDSVETAEDKVYDLCNGTQYYYENDKLWLKVYDENVAVEREDKISSYMISDNSYNGLISYKKLYGADGKVKEQAVSYDMITYIDLPIDADVTSVYCDNQYLYCKIIRNDENLYRIALSVFYDKVKVKYNNTYLSFEANPTTENDRTLVPMRFLFEQMGAEVEWEEETQTAVVTKGEDVISFSIDNNNASVNGNIKTMDVPARLINDKTMIPVRFLSEELGCTVEWDEDAKMVIITD